MRGLLLGVIGAAASAGAWLAAEHYQQANYGWMVCLVGLVTGICVHKGSTGNAAGFGRGALAIILTLGAIVGGRTAYAKYMQASSSNAKAAAVVTKPAAEPSADDEADDEQETTPQVVVPEAERELLGAGQANYTKSAMKKNFSDKDMIWLCVAALAAYLTGKGGDQAPAPEAEEDSAEPAEPQDMPENEAE